MERYLEQNVTGENSLRSKLLYMLCWILIAVFLIAAMFFGANIFGSNANALEINWLNGAALLIWLLLAGILFYCKDRLHMEYDYSLRDGELEICGIMNRRRRKRLAIIDVQRVLQAGSIKRPDAVPVSGGGGFKMHKWYVNTGLYYIVYMEEHARHCALLELNDEMAAGIRRYLPAGAWRGEEEKIGNASLS